MALLEIYDPASAPRPIGIDLGTTNSIVARMRDGEPVAIFDCDGEALVPSAVFYDRSGRIVVGREALRMAAEHPSDTIVSVKRFMGRGARDPETRRLGTLAFVEPHSEAEARSVRMRVAAGRIVTPVEVSAEILKALRQLAEDELTSVGGAVITVPAYFDDAQRQATKDAGRLAGIEVLRLLNEPTAAALAYGLGSANNGLFAVYDLGGGTFDVTILRLDDGVFQVKSTGGDSALGGDDMDRALADGLLRAMQVAPGEAPAERALVRLALDAARSAKHALSERERVEVELPTRGGGGEIRVAIARAEFEQLCAPLLARTGGACRRALRDAELSPGDLEGVILVGGATRVPCVRRYVAQLFGKTPLGDIDPDLVVAYGAAIQADLLAGQQRSAGEVLLLDVLPLSLGIETMGGVVEKILPRNSTIPAGAKQVFTSYADNQTGFELHVVQGERELASDCRSLARFTLKGLQPMAAGMARLEVTFKVDADGLLAVSAKEQTTGIEQRVEVKPSYGLSDAEIEQMLLDALDHGEEDLRARLLSERRVEANRILQATAAALAKDAQLLEPAEPERIEAAIAGLREACAGQDAQTISARVEALDGATRAWAGRRMDRAIAAAIAGKGVDDVERAVAHAKGIEAHLGGGSSIGKSG